MRRLLVFTLCVCLIGGTAIAESLCVCGLPNCQCFIQLGDEGMAVEAIQNALVSHGRCKPFGYIK